MYTCHQPKMKKNNVSYGLANVQFFKERKLSKFVNYSGIENFGAINCDHGNYKFNNNLPCQLK